MTPREPLGTVGNLVITMAHLEQRVRRIRAQAGPESLPAEGSAEARRLERWVAHTLIDEAIIVAEAARRGLHDDPVKDIPPEEEVDADLVVAVFEAVTADVTVDHAAVRDYYTRNIDRYQRIAGDRIITQPLAAVRADIAGDLLAAARGRRFDAWLDGRRAELTAVTPGYEHPGDPRGPEPSHRH